MKISVVVCVLNGADTIRRTLDSVLADPDPSLELIVIDGQSTDGTLDILNSYSDRITHCVSEPDGGPAEAISKGVRLSTGAVLCFLMADDWLEAGGLSDVRRAFIEHPEADIVSTGARLVSFSAGQEKTLIEKRGEEIGITTDRFLDTPFGAAFFWRREAYDRLGGLDPDYPHANDRRLLANAYFANAKCINVSKVIYNFRIHSGSRTSGDNLNIRRQFLKEHLTMADDWLQLAAAGPLLSDIRKWRAHQIVEIVRIDLHHRNFGGLLSLLGRELFRVEVAGALTRECGRLIMQRLGF